jgi:hypothetical protein
MALKMDKTAETPVEESRFSAKTQHTSDKPVTGMVSSSKAVKASRSQGVSLRETAPRVFTNGMSITVEGGRVMNLGNYETARIGDHHGAVQ